MSSILTNNGAMVALQTLKGINKDMNTIQDQISTGKKIGSASDNAAVWAVSKVMESDVSGFKSVTDSLTQGKATVDVASAGAERIVEVLNEMKQLAASGMSENADFAKIETELAAKTTEIESIRDASQFNGANLLIDDVAGSGNAFLTVLTSLDRSAPGVASTISTMTVAALDLANTMDVSGRSAVTDATEAATALGEIEAFLTTAINGAAALGSASKRLESQGEFISKLSDTMTSGIGALVDTDMEAASARLQALQTQQQLGVQALSIANQAPQTILSLFR